MKGDGQNFGMERKTIAKRADWMNIANDRNLAGCMAAFSCLLFSERSIGID